MDAALAPPDLSASSQYIGVFLAGSERQDGRRCIAGLRMISHAKASEPSSQGDWIYTFCRVTAAAGNSPPPKASHTSGLLYALYQTVGVK